MPIEEDVGAEAEVEEVTQPSNLTPVRIDGLGNVSLGDVEELRLENAMRKHTLAVYKMCQGSKAAAARLLGIDRRTMYRKLKKYEAI